MMVTNSADDVVGLDGTTNSLTQGADRALLHLLRENCDAVVVGAQTIRHETIPLPHTTPLVVLTTTGDLADHRLLIRGNDTERLIIAGTAEALEMAARTLGDIPFEPLALPTGATGSDIEAAIGSHVQGHDLLIEGGPTIWSLFSSVIDEVVVSVTPPPTDSHQGSPRWWPGGVDRWHLDALFSDDAQMLYYLQRTGVRGVPSS